MTPEMHGLVMVLRRPAARALDWVACGFLSLAWVWLFADVLIISVAHGVCAAIAWRAADRMHGPAGIITEQGQVRSTALFAAVIASILILARILLDAAA